MQSVSISTWFTRLFIAVAVLVGLWALQSYALPYLNDYYQIVLINAGIAVILAVSLNLINGITGQFSLGHAGFMAIGAYVAAYFTKVVGTQLLDPLNFALGLLLGAAAAGVAGLIVGLPSLRLRGDYLAIVTLGFNQIIISVIRNLEIVGGAAGYTNIPRFTTFAWTFALVIGCILSIRNLASSNLGRSMRAVRDDEITAEAAGINTTQIKVMAFVFSAMWAGVAGALQVHFIQVANPGDFTFLRSVEVVVSVVLGGLGSITGSALAAVTLQVLQEVLRDVPGVIYTSLGLIALATYWSFPKHRAAIKAGFGGIVGWLSGPIVALILVGAAYFFAYPFLSASKGALRYILYALILIVLMLLRPQGLLGRAEWSLSIKKSKLKIKKRSRGRSPLMAPKPHDICERTFAFAVQIVPLCEGLCAAPGARRTLGQQLLRAATSIGANVEEAQAGQSRPDFISKTSIALKEAREAAYWLKLIIAAKLDTSRQIEAALNEAEELKRILGAILVSAKKNSP